MVKKGKGSFSSQSTGSLDDDDDEWGGGGGGLTRRFGHGYFLDNLKFIKIHYNF